MSTTEPENKNPRASGAKGTKGANGANGPGARLSASLDLVEEKVRARERLGRDDGLALLSSPDLLRVGRLADLVRRRKAAETGAGEAVYFINNRHINHTNICKNMCRFCAFSREAGAEGAYALTLEEILGKAREAAALGATELHIVGGEHPQMSYAEVREMMLRLHETVPDITLTAFTASEIVHFAQDAGMSEEEVLLDLKDVGLGSLPGGGAEIFSPRVRGLVCERKISGERWLEVHKTAHRAGLPTNATMLYGHVESLEERVDHLLALREAQDETGGFLAFIPLAFHPQNTELSHLPGSTGVEDLKVLAAARLLLDNFPHIKAYWVMIGLKLAQVSLFFGVDDVDGTIVEETITRAAGSQAGQAVARAELERIIADAGRVPVERDTFYLPVAGQAPAEPSGAASAPQGGRRGVSA